MDIDIVSGRQEDPPRSDSPLPLAQRRRHDTLWFEDGSVILATPEVLFRVYRGTLSRHSPIFHDLFSLPQPVPGPDQETMDGLPVINLYDDPIELSHLLSALHDRSYYSHTKQSPFPLLMAILRLSTKYQIEVLRKHAMFDLTIIYPDTLERFDIIYSGSTSNAKDADHIDLIQVAREADATKLLPLVFYYVLRSLSQQEKEVTPRKTFEYLSRLSKEDALRVYFGREKLRQALAEGIGKFLFEPSPAACRSGTCATKKADFLARNDAWKAFNGSGLTLNPRIPIVCGHYLVDLCAFCQRELQVSMKEGRKNAWNELPEYFGLGTWETLRTSTAEAFGDT